MAISHSYSHYVTMCSSLCEIACCHTGLSGQTVIRQTLSPSGKMNGSRLQWSIHLCWMTLLSGNQDSIYLEATEYFYIASRPTKATVHPVKRSDALQQSTCAVVSNAKQCYILSTVAHRPSWSDCTQLMMLPLNG